MTFMRKPGSSCAKLIGAQPMGTRMLPIRLLTALGWTDAVSSLPLDPGKVLTASLNNTSVARKEEPDLENETSAFPVPFHPGHLLLLYAADSLLR